MDDRCKKSFDFCADATKQLIALSTGVLALTISFKKEFIGSVDISTPMSVIISVSWICYFISILSGVLALLALTGTLAPRADPPWPDATIREGSTTFYSACQILFFAAATLAITVFGVLGIWI